MGTVSDSSMSCIRDKPREEKMCPIRYSDCLVILGKMTLQGGHSLQEDVSKKMHRAKLDRKLQLESTIRELQEKNDKITDEINRIKRLNEEMELATVEVFEENKAQKRKNEELSWAFQKRDKDVEMAEKKNAELAAEITLLKKRIREQDELLYASLVLLKTPPSSPTGSPISDAQQSSKEDHRKEPIPSCSKDSGAHNKSRAGKDSGDVLNFINGEKVPRCTNVYQLDNGTIVYHKYRGQHKLYVKWQGKKVQAEIPGGVDITMSSVIQSYGNAIYISDGWAIFKAVFTPPDSFLFYFRRNYWEGETVGRAGCTCTRGRKTYAYRMCDDPVEDGIVVDYSGDGTMVGIFKKHVFYHEYDACAVSPTIQRRSDNVFAIVTSQKYWSQLVSNDLSSLIYYTEGSRSTLYTLDNQYMEFLAPLKCGRNLGSIVGVHNGWITAHYGCDESDVSYLLHAQLPTGYFTIPQSTNGFEVGSKQESVERKSEITKEQVPSPNLLLKGENWALKVRNNRLTNELEEAKKKYRRLLMMSGRNVK